MEIWKNYTTQIDIKTEFNANVVEILEREGKYLVELDQTAFFPGGGGQFCDRGTLNGIEVLDMLEENGKVYHIIEENLSENQVKGAIDWDRREMECTSILGSMCFLDVS